MDHDHSIALSISGRLVTLATTGTLTTGTSVSISPLAPRAAGGTMVYPPATPSPAWPRRTHSYVGLVDARMPLRRRRLPRFQHVNASTQLTVNYGSSFEGAGEYFTMLPAHSSTSPTGFSLGFFNSGFDVAAETQAGNLQRARNYNLLQSTRLAEAAAPGFLTTGGSVPKTVWEDALPLPVLRGDDLQTSPRRRVRPIHDSSFAIPGGRLRVDYSWRTSRSIHPAA